MQTRTEPLPDYDPPKVTPRPDYFDDSPALRPSLLKRNGSNDHQGSYQQWMQSRDQREQVPQNNRVTRKVSSSSSDAVGRESLYSSYQARCRLYDRQSQQPRHGGGAVKNHHGHKHDSYSAPVHQHSTYQGSLVGHKHDSYPAPVHQHSTYQGSLVGQPAYKAPPLPGASLDNHHARFGDSSESLPRKSAPLVCPTCQNLITTDVRYKASSKTHYSAAFTCCITSLCALCICFTWIPYAIKGCKSAQHFCPICDSYIGTAP